MRVGILYNLVDNIEKGRDDDKLADNEVLETAAAVKAALESSGHEASLERVSLKGLPSLKQRYDFIFNLAEGIGDDATQEPEIARILEESGIPFTGSGSGALRLCLDKRAAKQHLIRNKIPTPQFQLFKRKEDKKNPTLRFPLIVKPVHEDGSIGITPDSVVYDDSSLKAKVKEVLSLYRQPAIVEEYIDGREINVAVLGNGEGAEILPLSEIIFDFEDDTPKIVSFDAKWIEDSPLFKGTKGECPADVPEKMREKIIALARKSFLTMGCSDYARVDFRVREDELFVLEVNPNPCINPCGAGFIASGIAAGYDYADLMNRILEIAMKRNKL
jgi:D-alanine-D-alanine ligase